MSIITCCEKKTDTALNRCILGRIRLHPRPLVQCIWRLRYGCRTSCYSYGKSGKPLGATVTSVQLKFRIFPTFHGCVFSSPHASSLPSLSHQHRREVQKISWLTLPFPPRCTAVICLIFLICSLRTNVVFFVIFLSLVGTFCCLAAAYWSLALVYMNGSNTSAMDNAQKLTVAGGAFAFVTSMAGWWIFFAIMLASLDFPISIPVGDLSHIIKGASERKGARDVV